MPVTPVEKSKQLAGTLAPNDPLTQMEGAGIPINDEFARKQGVRPPIDANIVDTPLAGSATEVRKSSDLQLVANQNDPFASLQQQEASQQQDPFGSLVQGQADPFASVAQKPEAEGLVMSGIRKIGHALVPLAGSLPGISVGGDIGMAAGAALGVAFPPIAPVSIPAGGFIGAGIGAAITGYIAAKGQSYILDAIGYHDEAQLKANEEAHPLANSLENIAEAGIAFSVGSAPIAQRAITAGGMGALSAITQYLQTGEVSKLDVAEAMIGGAIFSTPRPWAMRLMPHVLTQTPRAPTEIQKLPQESQDLIKETTQDVKDGYVKSQVLPAVEKLATELGEAPKVEDTRHYRSLEREKQVLMRAARPDDAPRIAKIEAEQQSLKSGQTPPDELAKILGETQKLTPEALVQASDLGIIGPKPATAEIEGKTPAQRAADAFPPDEFPGPTEIPDHVAAKITKSIKSGRGHPDAANIRTDLLEGRIGEIQKRMGDMDTPEAVQSIMREIAQEKGGYPEARRGDIKLGQIEFLSQITGIPAKDLDIQGIGRKFQNDKVLATYSEAMIQAAVNVKEASKLVRSAPNAENLAKFTEARMRQSTILSGIMEQVSGLTAEWGRTGNVFQEFKERVKDVKTLSDFLAEKKGESIEDTINLAKHVADSTPEEIAKMLNASRKAGWWEKAMYLFKNALLSGPWTHTAYTISNEVFAQFGIVVKTPIAAAIGRGREMLGYHDTERVYLGESVAREYARISSVPDAIVMAYRAVKSGVPELLPQQDPATREAWNAFSQQRKAIQGPIGTAIGAPSNVISGIHTFFNLLGFREHIEALAYRQTVKEGLKPFSDEFWARQRQLSIDPPASWIDPAIKAGANYTFTQKLGPTGRAFEQLVHTPGGKFIEIIVPFRRVPFNIFKEFQQMTPLAAASLLNHQSEVRANLLGERGPIARDTQWAKLVGGSAIAAMVMGWAVNDRITGDIPLDPDERHRWQAMNKQPYSIRIGDGWYSYRKFGALGDVIGSTANLYSVISQITQEKYADAAYHLVMAVSSTLTNSAGMQGLFNLVQALQDSKRYGARYATSLATSFVPYSTFLRQMASSTDPYMREAKTFIDQLRYMAPIPNVGRRSLLPERDWLGNIRPNPGYGTGAILRHTQANEDPVNLEMNRLQLNPTPPSDKIGGIKLSPEVYDELQSRAGPFTYMMLSKMVNSPSWQKMPVYMRSEMIQSIINDTRDMARDIVQARHKSIIMQQFEIQRDRILGNKIGTKKVEPMRPEQ